MKRIYPKIEEETWEKQSAAGRYNPASVAIVKGNRLTLNCGSADDLYFWTDKKETYVLTINNRMGYIGLDIYSGAYNTCSVFLQNYETAEEILGKNWGDKSPAWLRKVLSNYID